MGFLCYHDSMSEKRSPKKQISVRLDEADLCELKRLGDGAKPIAVNLRAMIGVAVRDYVQRHGKNPAKLATYKSSYYGPSKK